MLKQDKVASDEKIAIITQTMLSNSVKVKDLEKNKKTCCKHDFSNILESSKSSYPNLHPNMVLTSQV